MESSISIQERMRLAVERFKHRMEENEVSIEKLARHTRMDKERLCGILDGRIVMTINDYCDIYFSIYNADDRQLPADRRNHYRLKTDVQKLAWRKDAEGNRIIPEPLIRRFLHHLEYVADEHLAFWQLSYLPDGKLVMEKPGQGRLILTRDIIYYKSTDEGCIEIPFTKQNFGDLITNTQNWK